MKIGLIIYGSLDTLSGGYLYDRQLVAHLRNAGCDVDIISLLWRNYAYHLSDNLRPSWLHQFRNTKYDLILQDELNHPSLFAINPLLRRICDCPFISIVHHLRSSEEHPRHLLPLYRLVEQIYLRSVDGFIYNSQTTRRIVEQQLGHAKPHIVAYPAADHRHPPGHQEVLYKIARLVQSDSPLQLLFIGNLMARKGLHTLLNALARLRSTKWRLHVVGSHQVDPTYSAAMRHRANTLSLSAHISWHGRVSDEKLASLLTNSDLLVMPSYEGFGIVYLEAMAYGIPVVASHVGAAPEVVEHAVSGYLVPHGDDCALAEKLDLLLNNRTQLATLSYHARKRYEAHPTWHESMSSAHHWLHKITH